MLLKPLLCTVMLAGSVGCAHAIARSSTDELAILRSQVAALQQTITELETTLRVRPDRVEVHGVSDGLLGLYTADVPSETALYGYGIDGGGRVGKSGSLSWRWVDPSPEFGYNVARLNATYIDHATPPDAAGRRTWRDYIGVRVFGGQGICLFCPDDSWRSAPGDGVLWLRGVIRWQLSDSASVHGVSERPSDAATPSEFIRQLDEQGRPIWLAVYR